MQQRASSSFYLQRLALIGVVAALSLALVRLLPFVQLSENLLYDLRMTLLSPRGETDAKVVLVGITEETLAAMPYRSPVDRAFLSGLVRDLEAKGAALVAFDILFDQATEPAKDRDLRATLAAASIPIVVAGAGPDNNLLPQQQAFLETYTADLERGNATVFRNSLDGVVRRLPLRRGSELGLAAQIVESSGHSLPQTDELVLDYRLGDNASGTRFSSYPAHTLALLPAAWFAGKIVLIGAELELEDRHATPYSRVLALEKHVPGVRIQAHAVSQLLEQRYLRVPGLAWVAASCLLLAALGQLGARGRYRISLQLSLMLVFLVLLWAGAALLFAAAGTMVEIMAPTLALLLSSLFAMLRQWRQEGDNRRFIQAAFAKYLAPEYVNRLIANPDWLEVGGERREMTFLFTDLAGFTPLTESLEADTLVALVNEYLDGTCEIVTRHGGMVANIVGDALYVIFNAPLPQPDHAGKAVEAALELDRFCLAFQQRKQAAGIPLDVTRIGVNTGDGVIGNYGGSRRLEYTAMGDGINVAARLESVNKHLGTRVCISESTAALCPDFDFRPVGKLVLKGKSTGVQTYTPVIDEAGELLAEYAAAYRQMAASAPGALAEFRRLRERYPDDALVKFHCRRLDAGQAGDLIVMEEK